MSYFIGGKESYTYKPHNVSYLMGKYLDPLRNLLSYPLNGCLS